MTSKYNHSNTQRRRNLETNMIIWLMNNENNEKIQLRKTINFHETFNNTKECIDYITECLTEKIFFIIAEEFITIVLPVIHDFIQIYSIYILNSENDKINKEIELYRKVRGIYHEISDIHQIIIEDVTKLIPNDNLPISVLSSNEIITPSNRLHASFMYFQLFLDILLHMDVGNAKKDMIDECRRQYDGNEYELKNINDFENNYSVDNAIQWYTRDIFLYRILNKALRIEDLNILFKLRFIIKDLYFQLEKSNEKDQKEQSGIITVYRGQLLPVDQLEKLKNNIRGFLSINNFMSTTTNRNMALIYSGGGLQRPINESILFEIIVDQEKCPRPFHNIRNLSIFDSEDEVLFAVGMVCRIQTIEFLDGIWNVKMTLNGEDDENLYKLTLHLRKELGNQNDMFTLGRLLIKMGEYDRLEEFYLLMLEQMEENDPKKERIYSYLGSAYESAGKFEQALIYHQKYLNLQISPNSLSCITAHANLGIVYHSMNNFSESLIHMLKAKEILEEHFPSEQKLLSTICNNLGSVYSSMNDLTNAYDYHEKSRIIKEKLLPFNHPELTTTLNNLAEITFKRGDYTKALEEFLKILDIDIHTLPENHKSLANTYHNIAYIQMELKYYLQALENETIAFNIAKKSNHPDMYIYQKMMDDIQKKINGSGCSLPNTIVGFQGEDYEAKKSSSSK